MSTSLPTDPTAAAPHTSDPPDLAADPRRATAASGIFEHFTARRGRGRVNRGYSRVVSLLRIVLPLAAVAVFAALILWPDVQEMLAPEPEVAQEAAAPVTVDQSADQTSGRMANPRFSGIDDSNRPYSISGSEAHPGDAEGVMEIADPTADITLEDGSWLALRAQQARYDEAAGRIDLEGDVNLFRDDGYSVYSDQVTVDIEARQVWGDAGVIGYGPQGEIVAEGFRVDGQGRVIVFTGESRLRLRGGGDAETVY